MLGPQISVSVPVLISQKMTSVQHGSDSFTRFCPTLVLMLYKIIESKLIYFFVEQLGKLGEKIGKSERIDLFGVGKQYF
jgi:hypothetical protein